MADQCGPNPQWWARSEETSQPTHQASELTELLISACLYSKSCGKLLCPLPVIGAIISRKLDKTVFEADVPSCHMLHFLTVCHPSSYGVVCLWVKIRSHTLKCQGFFKHYFCFQGSKQEIPPSVPQLVGTGISDMQPKPGLAYGNIFSDLKSSKCLLLFYVDKYQNQEDDKSLLKEACSVPESTMVKCVSVSFSFYSSGLFIKRPHSYTIIYLPVHALTKLLCWVALHPFNTGNRP